MVLPSLFESDSGYICSRVYYYTMASFEYSTQKRNWMFKKDEIRDIRMRTNAKARECWKSNAAITSPQLGATSAAAALMRRGCPATPATAASFRLESTCNIHTPPAPSSEKNIQNTPPARPLPEPTSGKRKREGKKGPRLLDPRLSVSEEESLLAFYHNGIEAVCNSNDLSKKVFATATILFKRFFLIHSVMEDDPFYMMLTAVFLACKIEEEDTSGRGKMAQKIAMSTEDTKGGTDEGAGREADHRKLLAMEMRLMLGCRCDLVIHHPYRCIKVLAADMKVHRLEERAIKVIHTLYATDAPFHYEPFHISLAALLIASSEEDKSEDKSVSRRIRENALSYVIEKIPKEDKVTRASLEKYVDTIQKDYYDREKNRKRITRKTLKRLWRRANRCRIKFDEDKRKQQRKDELEQHRESEDRRAEKRRRREAEGILLGVRPIGGLIAPN